MPDWTEQRRMKKVSLIAAMASSAILPGSGLTYLPNSPWFPIYLILDAIGFGLMLVGGTNESLGTSKVSEVVPELLLVFGLFVLVPVWCVSAVHTFVAVRRYNMS